MTHVCSTANCVAGNDDEYCIVGGEQPVPATDSPEPASESIKLVMKPQGPAYLYYPRIRGCGHKFRNTIQPNHRNCKNCWFTYFFQQKEETEHIAKIVTEHGTDPTLFRYGKKFLTKFLDFAKVLAEYEHFKNTVGQESENA